MATFRLFLALPSSSSSSLLRFSLGLGSAEPGMGDGVAAAVGAVAGVAAVVAAGRGGRGDTELSGKVEAGGPPLRMEKKRS